MPVVHTTIQWNDTERKAAYAASERGAFLTRLTSDNGSQVSTYDLRTVANRAIIGSSGALIATVRTYGRVYDPSL